MKKIIIVLLLVFLVDESMASISEYFNIGGYGTPGDYLSEFAPDASGFGVGGGSVALTNNTGAMYLNPGGLGHLENMEILLCYAYFFQNYHYLNLAFAYPFGKYGVLGLNVVDITTRETPGYDEFGIPTGENYRGNDNSFILSYGNVFKDRFGVGLNLKLASQRIEKNAGLGVGFDIGGQVIITKWLSAGLSLSNIGGPRITLIDKADIFSPTLKIGLGSKLLQERLSINFDVQILELFPDDDAYNGNVVRPVRISGGAEFSPIQYLDIRSGINDRFIAIGAGFNVRKFSVDYAILIHYVEKDHNMPPSHAFSVRYQFGKPVPEKEQELDSKIKEVTQIKKLHEIEVLYIKAFYQKAFDKSTVLLSEFPKDNSLKELHEQIRVKLATEKTDKYLSEAQIAFDEMNYNKTSEVLKKLLEIAPNNEPGNKLKERLVIINENRSRLVAIKSLYTQNRYEDMQKELIIVLSIDSTNEEALAYREKISVFINEKIAEDCYAQATKYYYEDKDVDKASTALMKTLKLNPKHKDASLLYEKLSKEIKEMYLKKVGQMVDNNDLTVDNNALKKLITLDLQDQLIEVQRLYQNKQYSQALSILESILEKEESNEKAKSLKEDVLFAQKSDKADLLYNEALKLFNENRFENAESSAKEAHTLTQSNKKLNDLLQQIQMELRKRNLTKAKVLIDSGKKDELLKAQILVQKYIAVDSTNEEAIELLMETKSALLIMDANDHIDAGDFEKANNTIQEALSINPDSKDVQEAYKNIKEVLDVLVE